jgi:hypothetical protein
MEGKTTANEGWQGRDLDGTKRQFVMISRDVQCGTYVDGWIESVADEVGCVEADFAETVVVHVHWEGTVVLAHCDFVGARLVDGELSFDVDIAKN